MNISAKSNKISKDSELIKVTRCWNEPGDCIRWVLPILLLSLALGGCGPSQPVEQHLVPLEPQVPPSQNPASPTLENLLQLGSTPKSTEMPFNPPVEKYVALAKKDLASRLKIDAEKITLAKTEEKNWLNASLGCPSIGVFYAQGRVPGYRIWLEVEGKEYDYHTDLAGQVILCPDTTTPTPIIGVPID